MFYFVNSLPQWDIWEVAERNLHQLSAREQVKQILRDNREKKISKSPGTN